MKRSKRFCAALLVVVLLATCFFTACGQSYEKQCELGEKYLSEGNYEEAILAFQAAIKIDPRTPRAYLSCADVYVAQNQLENALSVLSDAEQTVEEPLSILEKERELLKDQTEESGLDSLQAVYEKLAALDALSVDDYLKWAQTMAEAGRMEDAGIALERGWKNKHAVQIQKAIAAYGFALETDGSVTTPHFGPDEIVQWTDPFWEAIARNYLKKAEGDIFTSELYNVVEMQVQSGSQAFPDANYVTINGSLIEMDTVPLPIMTSLAGVEAFQGLKILWLGGKVAPSCPADLSPLANLTMLEELSIFSSDDLADLTPLEGIVSLKTLALTNCPSLTDLSPLKNLVQLKQLNLCYNSNLADLSPLAGLTNLQKVSLDGIDPSADLTLLAHVPTVTTD